MKHYARLCLVLLLSACSTQGPGLKNNYEAGFMPSWPTYPESPRIKFVTSFKSPSDLNIRKGLLTRLTEVFIGSEPDHLSRPYGISVHEELIAVADPDSPAVHLYELKKNSYRKIKRIADTYLESPIAVAQDSKHLYIADSKLNTVFVLEHNEVLSTKIEGFERPTALAVDLENENLFVTDTIAHSIKVFSSDGELERVIGNRGDEDNQFNYPSHVAVNKELLVVNDTMNFRIKIFDKKGSHLSTFGKQGDASGYLTQSKGLALDSDGNIYVADALANRIQIFSQSGDFLLEFGAAGNQPGEFRMPTGIAIWDDMIYIADSYNQRIQVFKYLKKEQ